MLSGVTVEVEAFDAEGTQVARHVLTAQQWYVDSLPLIDEEAERVRLGVVRIEGKQIDANGRTMLRWRSLYAPDGAETEGWEWDKNGKEQYTRLVP